MRSEFSAPSIRGALVSGSAMALVSMGDAVLYPVLPVYGDRLGLSAIWIGVILSINRFVRVVSNTWSAQLISRFGTKRILIVFSLIAVLSTISYGFALGSMIFLLARIAWGLCYSSMKIASMSIATSTKSSAGLGLGIVQALIALGALFALWIGPKLAAEFGLQIGFGIISAIGLLGVIISFASPEVQASKELVRYSSTLRPSAINLLIFTLSFSIDGVLVVALAQLLTEAYPEPENLLLIVGSYLMLKRATMGFMSLLGGYMTRSLSIHRLYSAAVISAIVGLILIAKDYVSTGVIIAFISNSLVVLISPMIAIERADGNYLQAISSTNTWWVTGSAFGALVGVSLLQFSNPFPVFITLSLLTTLIFTKFNLDGKRNHTIL